MEPLSFEGLRARALGMLEAIQEESPGLGVLVVLVDTNVENTTWRFAAETSLTTPNVRELLRLVAGAWESELG